MFVGEKIVLFSGKKIFVEIQQKNISFLRQSIEAEVITINLRERWANLKRSQTTFLGWKRKKKDLHISRLKCATKEYCNS
jgi:hypothetical protein